MASERQIAANRRNARKSTGPRSGAGRKRASRNAYRYGLTLNITSAAFAKQLDKLVREIAGDSKDAIVLERARAIAQAELDLARVRRPGADFTRAAELLARQIAGSAADPMTLAVARDLADAMLELARVRRAKVSLIERACAFGELDPPQAFSTVTQIKRFFSALDRG